MFEKHCANCDLIFKVYKKSQLEKRKYCSASCVYSSKGWNIGRAEKLRMIGAPYRGKNEMTRESTKKATAVRMERRLNSFVKSGGHVLDITVRALEQYWQKQLVCEICKRPERISTSSLSIEPNRLSADHDHTKRTFRGLLCSDCNRKLGWYENLREDINSYLDKS